MHPLHPKVATTSTYFAILNMPLSLAQCIRVSVVNMKFIRGDLASLSASIGQTELQAIAYWLIQVAV